MVGTGNAIPAAFLIHASLRLYWEEEMDARPRAMPKATETDGHFCGDVTDNNKHSGGFFNPRTLSRVFGRGK